MTYKVFLFGNYSWLYCSNVKHKNGIWTGWVENGAWFLHFDENTSISKACYDAKSVNNPVITCDDAKLVWACNANLKNIGRLNYNGMIHDAETRYKNGEPANYEIEPEKVDNEYQMYLKLKAKYEDEDDDIAF